MNKNQHNNWWSTPDSSSVFIKPDEDDERDEFDKSDEYNGLSVKNEHDELIYVEPFIGVLQAVGTILTPPVITGAVTSACGGDIETAAWIGASVLGAPTAILCKEINRLNPGLKLSVVGIGLTAALIGAGAAALTHEITDIARNKNEKKIEQKIDMTQYNFERQKVLNKFINNFDQAHVKHSIQINNINERNR